MGEFSLELLPSLGLVLLFGLIFGAITEKIGLPSLVGYLLAGVLLGGSGLSLVGESLREVSPDLREMALLMILLKAGLNLAWESLRKVGRPALLLSFCPASFEILSCLVFAPLLFSLNLMESALLGSVLAAVSPAVVVPRMVRFMEKGVGKKSHAPEIVLAGASLDDVFVILLFSSLLSILMGGDFSYLSLLELPISIISGVVVGFLLGKSLSRWSFYRKISGEQRVLLLLGISFCLLGIEDYAPFSPLLAVMVLAMSLDKNDKTVLLSSQLTSLWKGAELLLFVLVGSEVAVGYALEAGAYAVVLLCFGLMARSFGVLFATVGTKLEPKQRIFMVVSYLPKATVQAGIGGIPLAMGVGCGEIILTLAVLSILITAPLGAFLIDRFGEGLLDEVKISG